MVSKLKGIVFVKLEAFVKVTWGPKLWDELLQEANLDSGGSYTTVGLFDDQEFFTLAALIVNKRAITAQELQKKFGKWMFKQLYATIPNGAHDFVDVFQFLHGVQNIIHVEVKKLYPDILLAEFDLLFENEKTLIFHYKSPRKLCYFCEGLVYGLSEHLNQQVVVSHLECEYNKDDRCVLEVTKIG
ncbi:MAG: putative hydrocarbon binding protein [Paraglaciecola sp.]